MRCVVEKRQRGAIKVRKESDNEKNAKNERRVMVIYLERKRDRNGLSEHI